LSVRDFGAGMVGSPVPRGLSPLVSTKVQGSGLGIPFAAKVCDVHGGRLEFIHHDPGTEVVMIMPMEEKNVGQSADG
jgi:nitrogen-specific signal transduction histidine kinase